jgi:hypothetical protein
MFDARRRNMSAQQKLMNWAIATGGVFSFLMGAGQAGASLPFAAASLTLLMYSLEMNNEV